MQAVVSRGTIGQNADRKVSWPSEGREHDQVSCKGVEQSIFRRDFKIQRVTGDPGQKDKQGYQAVRSQIESGLAKGYADKEVVSAVVRAV